LISARMAKAISKKDITTYIQSRLDFWSLCLSHSFLFEVISCSRQV
jgi:hypothetical protein